jgi:hypothetical protein
MSDPNDKGVVGKLDFNGPALLFTGDVDESVKLFVDAVEKLFLGRIEKAYEDGFVAGIKKSQESKVTQLIEAQLKEKRVWVDLTDDEIDKAIEAKLKEKNNG